MVDLLSFPELRDSELVLVDINPKHLDPVVALAKKVAAHYQAPTRISGAREWRGGVLDGADYIFTAFAQGGPAYEGVPFHYEICVPQDFGIFQNVGDTTGMGAMLRTMRTAPELIAIGRDMERRCPGALLLNYVNPMAMLTRIMNKACPKIRTVGLCHNIQYGIRDLAYWLGVTHHQLRYEAAGINHMDWFLRLEYLDGRDAYPDLLKAAENPEIFKKRTVQFELLRALGAWTTESAGHCAEYLPYFMPREKDRKQVQLGLYRPPVAPPPNAPRWNGDSDLMQQIDGRKPLELDRTFEYGAHIVHAMETAAVHRMHANVMNEGLIDNFTKETCVEVCCTVDRLGIHPHRAGTMPLHLAALCRGMADMQTLGSDAFLEHDLNKAFLACAIDPCTAACATPAVIKECFNKLLVLEARWLEEYWGANLRV